MNLSGWQAIAAFLIAAGLGWLGAEAPNQAATVGLFNLASAIVGGTFALLQRQRDPASRTRTSDRGDRSITAAAGVPLERTPPPEPQGFPAGTGRRPK